MGERREVSIISHRPVTSIDLKQERLFFRHSVSTFLKLVEACSHANARHRTVNKPNINFTMNSTFTRLVEQCLFNLGLITSSNPTR